MRHSLLLAALTCALIPGNLHAQNTLTSKIAPQKGWLNDLSAGRAQALKTGKPMLVVFRCDP